MYPLPRIDTCLDAVHGARCFSTFDLRSGYHQVLMDDDSRDKTTFVTREGTFRFWVMSFGLTGVPATFQRLMDLVMCGLNLDICLVYLDDIIVFVADVTGHLNRLRAVLDVFKPRDSSSSPANVVSSSRVSRARGLPSRHRDRPEEDHFCCFVARPSPPV